jgi:hypothetical protein
MPTSIFNGINDGHSIFSVPVNEFVGATFNFKNHDAFVHSSTLSLVIIVHLLVG